MLNTAYDARTIATLPRKRASGDALYPPKWESLLREGSHIGLFEAGFKRTRVGQHPQISTQIAAAGAAKPLLLCESCDVSRNLFFYVRRRFWTRRSAGWATEVGVEQRPAIGDGILFGSGCHLGFGDKDVVRKANAR